MNDLSKSCKITIQYDRELSQIVGRRVEINVVSEGLPFVMFLNFFFKTYPEIERKFPPGALAFLINGVAPLNDTVLKDGDKIAFAAYSK